MKIPHPVKGRSRKIQVAAAAAGVVLAGGTAYAASLWVIPLATGSSSNAQGAGIASLVMGKITTGPTLNNLLYPSATAASPGSGDVTFTLNNPNPYPVAVTGVILPGEPITGASTNDAQAYTSSALNTTLAGCNSGATTPSTVTWASASSNAATTTPETFSAGTRGGETEVGAFAIAANATITVTLVDDAAMDTSAPIACAGSGSGPTYTGAFFVMPSLSGISATAGAGALTPVANGSNVTTGW